MQVYAESKSKSKKAETKCPECKQLTANYVANLYTECCWYCERTFERYTGPGAFDAKSGRFDPALACAAGCKTMEEKLLNSGYVE
jgi:hypothetical protein